MNKEFKCVWTLERTYLQQTIEQKSNTIFIKYQQMTQEYRQIIFQIDGNNPKNNGKLNNLSI